MADGNLPGSLHFVDRSRPILLEEPRHRPVGQQSPVRLTSRAVVRLVVRVSNPLHGEPHTGQGSLYRPCTAIPSRNAVTFSGNPAPTSSRRRFVQSISVAFVASNS